jgi:CO dehydrogenase maturation factor
MKLAVTGKGGTGKTTVAASLARHCAAKGLDVIAIDADPDANLASAVGLPDGKDLAPLVEMKELIGERTESKPGQYGTYFKMNPLVSDIPERFWREHAGVRVMNFGTVDTGGSGCVCPESVFLKALLSHVVLERTEMAIVDMEAGIEHLGRATATGVDRMIIVVEPGMRSVETAERIVRLAGEIGLRNLAAVANKVRSSEEAGFLKEKLGPIELLGSVAFHEEIMKADMRGTSPYDECPALAEEIGAIAGRLELP